MESNETYKLEGILKDKGTELVPAPLKATFERELPDLAKVVKDKIGETTDTKVLNREVETCIRNWVAEIYQLINHLRPVLEEKLQELGLQLFGNQFEKDFMHLALSVRRLIQFKKEWEDIDDIDVGKIAENALKDWEKETVIKAAYLRYVALMEGSEVENFVEFKDFTKKPSDFRTPMNPYENLLEIEKLGLKKGSKVLVFDSITKQLIGLFTIRRFFKGGRFNFEEKSNLHRSPFQVKLSRE